MYVMLLFMYYDLIKYIQYPAGQTLKGVVSGFLLGWILPQCAGAIGGCHIPVMPPILNHRQLNRKGWYSVILQAETYNISIWTKVLYIFVTVACGSMLKL